MTSGDIRVARHRGERWHYATDVARGYTLVSYSLLIQFPSLLIQKNL